MIKNVEKNIIKLQFLVNFYTFFVKNEQKVKNYKSELFIYSNFLSYLKSLDKLG